MPLYIHKHTGEKKRTVPGSYEDRRVSADPAWVRQPGALAPAGAEDEPQNSPKVETVDLPARKTRGK